MDFKLNLQLFADGGTETGEQGAGGDNQNNQPANTEPNNAPKTFSQEDIEVEVAKRMASEKAKWEKEYKKKAEHERKEQERLSKLSEDERREAEWKQKNADLEAREEALKLKEQQAEAVSVLNSRGIPVAFMPFLVTGTDNDKNMENITTFEKELKKLVDAQVKEKLKGKTPSTGNIGSIGKNNAPKKGSIIDIIKKNQVKR